MADGLPGECGGSPTGKNWVHRSIKRTPELRTRWSCPYDRQRAACEDPALMLPWFELVQLIKAKYDVLDEDAWNFDETGFLMGKTTSQLVVTGSDKPGKAKKLQPDDREWTTLIQKPSARWGSASHPLLSLQARLLSLPGSRWVYHAIR
jgi:hypothetical protein